MTMTALPIQLLRQIAAAMPSGIDTSRVSPTAESKSWVDGQMRSITISATGRRSIKDRPNWPSVKERRKAKYCDRTGRSSS